MAVSRAAPLLRGYAAGETQLFARMRSPPPHAAERSCSHACEEACPRRRRRDTPLIKPHLLLDLPVVVLVHRIIFFSLGDDLHLRLARLLDLLLELLLQLASFEVV